MKSEHVNLSRDRIDSVLFILLGIAFFFAALRYHTNDSLALSPAATPLLISVMLVALALWQFFKVPSAAGEKPFCQGMLPVLEAAVLSAVYVFGISRAGFIVATIVYLCLFLLLLHEHRIWMLAVVSLGTTILIYLVFGKFLHVMLP